MSFSDDVFAIAVTLPVLAVLGEKVRALVLRTSFLFALAEAAPWPPWSYVSAERSTVNTVSPRCAG